MIRDVKVEMRKRARVAMGMVDLLKDDIVQIRADANDFDLICLEESLKDAKSTLQMLTDSITEIEYMAYLYNSRNEHTPL